MIRRAAALLVAGGLVAVLAGGPAAAERIHDFSVALRVDPDGSLEVVEDIAYDFEGAHRHGIYRDIPVRYDRRWGEDHRLLMDVESVDDGAGMPRPFRVQKEGRILRIRIGSADRMLTGPQHYRVRYRVRGALLFFEKHDELYWNVTGHDWRVPILSARATVRLPDGAGPEDRRRCFTGSVGSKATECSWTGPAGEPAVQASGPLPPGSGLTLVVGLPKGLIAQPSLLRRGLDRLRELGGLWLLTPFAALAGMSGLWRTRGRDPEVGQAVVVRYEPPAGLSPAEVGALVDERIDVDDVTSTILDLAVRGHLRIRELENDGFLFLSDHDYQLERREPPQDSLRPHEILVLDGLFRDGSPVLLSSLKDRFYEDLAQIIETIETGLTGPERHFVRAPRKVRELWRGIGLALGVGAGFAGFKELIPLGGAIAVGVAAGVIALFAPAMPRKTRRGRQVYEEIVGFREFLARVEGDRLEREGRRDTATFERVLPYAQVLGVADPWAEAFADLYTRPPDWYVSSGGGDFVPRRFVADVGRALETMGRTVSSRPSSEGSGSSGFGGGGFSGGGFGGGGGGSW